MASRDWPFRASEEVRTCTLFGRRILDFVFARTGRGDAFSLSVSCTANSSSGSSSWMGGDVNKGVDISAGSKGPGLKLESNL